jgi:hypothetical protein
MDNLPSFTVTEALAADRAGQRLHEVVLQSRQLQLIR